MEIIAVKQNLSLHIFGVIKVIGALLRVGDLIKREPDISYKHFKTELDVAIYRLFEHHGIAEEAGYLLKAHDPTDVVVLLWSALDKRLTLTSHQELLNIFSSLKSLERKLYDTFQPSA
jgi:hypothetical protein